MVRQIGVSQLSTNESTAFYGMPRCDWLKFGAWFKDPALENFIKFWINYLIHEYSSLTQIILSTFLGVSHYNTWEHKLLFFFYYTPLQPTQFWFKKGVKSFRYVVLTPSPWQNPVHATDLILIHKGTIVVKGSKGIRQ